MSAPGTARGPRLVVDNGAAGGGSGETLTAVCVASLESVGRITSLFGSEAAGAAANEYAARLEELLRQHDQIIAINDTKHCLLIRGLQDRNHVMLAGMKLQRLFDAPMLFRGMQISLSVRAGIACGVQDDAEAEELFRAAEAAREVACSHERVFQVADDMDVLALHRHWQLNDKLEQAISEQRLRVFYQPKVRARERTLAGAEALVRWQHEDGLLAPGQFLPHLDMERMTALTAQVIRQSIRDLAGGDWMPPVSINLEPYMLADSGLIRLLLDELTLWDVHPGRLIVEVTENGLMSSLDKLCPEFNEMRERGVRVSMDDFGTGQSSLAQFKSLPLDELKIDRSFIFELAEDDAYRYLTRVMIELGKFFELSVVAEGVESELVAALLADMGCDMLQGFLFSPPLPLEEFASWQPPGSGPRPDLA